MYQPVVSPIGSRRRRSHENNGNREMSHSFEASLSINIPQVNNIEKGLPHQFSEINSDEDSFVRLLQRYVRSHEDLLKMRYPTMRISWRDLEFNKFSRRNITSLKQSVDIDGEMFVSKTMYVNTMKICCRCRKKFYLFGDNITDERCYYHWGKLVHFKPEDGRKGRSFYRCCLNEKYSTGCNEGRLHVWTGLEDGIDEGGIVDYDGFVCTKSRQIPAEGSTNKCFAVDCEMSFTRKGLEVTKVSIVDMKGLLVYNAYVKPDLEIVDFNTRFSRVTAKDMRNGSTKNIRDVQNDLMSFIDKDTILIGHGIENDMRALKIVHNKFVDTTDVFPHPSGLPNRISLKELASTILNRTIQFSSAGHDSYEDATSCMELMLWQVRRDLSDGIQKL